MLPENLPNLGPLLRRGTRQKHLKTFLRFVIGSLLSLPIHAQDQTNQSSAEKPKQNFQVLKRTVFNRGDHFHRFRARRSAEDAERRHSPGAACGTGLNHFRETQSIRMEQE